MRKRDVAVLLACVVAVIIAWSQEGNISIRHGFHIPLFDGGNHHYVPRPVIADVNADGHPNLIVVREPDLVSVIATHGISGAGSAVLSPRVIAETRVYADVIGLGVGFIRFPGNKSAAAAAATSSIIGVSSISKKDMKEHQVIAVVTSDYRLQLHDHNMQILWTSNVAAGSWQYHTPRQASVVVLPDRVLDKDVGMIIVGVQVARYSEHPAMSYACFNGGDGSLRWRHVEHDLSSDGISEVSSLQPDEFKFSEKHLSEAARSTEWRHFSEAVISAMPHSYSHPWDLKMLPFTLTSEKNRKKRGASRRGAEHSTDDIRRHTPQRPKDRRRATRVAPGDETGILGEYFAALRHRAAASRKMIRMRPLPNVLITHTPQGVSFVHLFTGRVVTSLRPLKRDTLYEDVNDDMQLDAVVGDVGAARQEYFGRHGVSEIRRCHGVIATNVPESTTDLIGEFPICDSQGFLAGLSYLRHVLRGGKYADASAAVGGDEHGAAAQAALHADPLSLIGSRNVGDEGTRAATPLVVHHRRPAGHHLYRQGRLAVFYVSAGVVTAVDAHTRRVAWRADTGSTFSFHGDANRHDAADVRALHSHIISQEDRDSRLAVHPHLTPYCFHTRFSDPVDVRSVYFARRRHEPMIIAVGTHEMTLINTISGTVETSVPLNATPVAPTVVADFNGDGVNDVLVFTSKGFDGYVVQRHVSGSGAALLMVITLATVVALFLSQYGGEATATVLGTSVESHHHGNTDVAHLDSLRRKTKRSTD